MKKVVLIIIIMLIVGCTNQDSLNFKDLDEMKYIEDNKDNIVSIILHKTTSESHNCYSVDIDKAYESIKNIEIVKKSNISVTDDYMSYIFTFKDGSKKAFSFEGSYLYYKGNSYTINNFNGFDVSKYNTVKCIQ